ncbi:hypothetical protein [Peribacillus butanolivorans]
MKGNIIATLCNAGDYMKHQFAKAFVSDPKAQPIQEDNGGVTADHEEESE